jgi:LysM repeat protein
MTYIIQPGDNLYRIALRYGVSVDSILRANDLANPNLLHTGQSIFLPGVELAQEEGEEPTEGAATTTHTVQSGENLFRIALRYGTTINALAAYNGLSDPRRIEPGQVLVVPLTDEAAPPAVEAAAPEEPMVVSPGGIAVQIGEPVYGGDGRAAEVPITVSNQSLTPAVAGGRYYIATNLDGNRRWITLLRAAHQEVPVPILAEPTPLWHAVVTLTDGMTFDAYAGCVYEETIYAEGDEPNAPGGSFHWTATLEDGWFDCGNSYQVKPEDLAPGQSATVPLTVYIMHPRESGPAARRIQRIELELFRSDGVSLGIVAARDY